jgi:hypothetical protein
MKECLKLTLRNYTKNIKTLRRKYKYIFLKCKHIGIIFCVDCGEVRFIAVGTHGRASLPSREAHLSSEGHFIVRSTFILPRSGFIVRRTFIHLPLLGRGLGGGR